MASKANPTMIAMAKRRSAPDGPAAAGAAGDPRSYNPHDPDRGNLPTRKAPRGKGFRSPGAQPYREWSPGAGPANELH